MTNAIHNCNLKDSEGFVLIYPSRS
jgi:hypothetical protein